jgi:glycosyltransferase involved in cell wall biosynthesis
MPPLRSLHVGNVANVAYGYAKILFEQGCPVQVICHDIKHLMSQPEWDDLALNPDDFLNENDFYDNTADLGRYTRPSWYCSGKVTDPYKDLGRTSAGALRLVSRCLPLRVKLAMAPTYYRIMDWRLQRKAATPPTAANPGAAQRGRPTELNQLVAWSRRLGPRWSVDRATLSSYLPHRAWVSSYASGADVIFAYVLSPIYAMLCGLKPYVSVEIGTMRELPLGSSPTANALWLAYRQAGHVLLTNPDNRKFAEEAELESYSFCPHPVDEDVFRPGEEPELRRDLAARYGAELIIIAPARQNWKIKGNQKYIRAFARLLDSGVRAVLIVPAWGQEIERSRQLCRELGIAERVRWIPPMSEPLLARHYRAADIVLDQFQLGVFGLISAKAMACGRPVLTSYDHSHHEWCFSEQAPVISCEEDEAIAAAMAELAASPEKRRRIGQAARAWIMQHHSKKIVVAKLGAAMETAIRRFERNSGREGAAGEPGLRRAGAGRA